MSHDYLGKSRIAVVDFGGQYAHLIASRIRRLGAFSEIVQPAELTPVKAKEFKGIIYSGGPESVYDTGAPFADPAVLDAGIPVLGICYGHQLIMHQLGGRVNRSDSREYGPAALNVKESRGLLENAQSGKTVWMSHGDEVIGLPDGFHKSGSTADCAYAAVSNKEKKIYGIQFHPEVTHTDEGELYLTNFIKICGLQGSWDLEDFLRRELERLKSETKDKKVFFLVSGGVDSTVAFAMLSKALQDDQGDVHHRLKGLLVDTGYMRLNEAGMVEQALSHHGIDLIIENASDQFYNGLASVAEPEKKRAVIGRMFLEVQANRVKSLGLNPDEWMLGQGTIYPDTIESGATSSSHTIKTHHNRVEEVARLMEKGMVIEPLKDLYKDEVRKIGSLLGLPGEIVNRHPFPGPGLAVRCLCTDDDSGETVRAQKIKTTDIPLAGQEDKIYKLPVSSVGVQGDQRTYAHPALIVSDSHALHLLETARVLPNRLHDINRVLYTVKADGNIEEYILFHNKYATAERIRFLQQADDIADRIQRKYGLYEKIWQFPVVLLPFGQPDSGRESIVLRPIESVDAMTARPFMIEADILNEMAGEIMDTGSCSAVFFDLTSKPPGTIEWE